MYNGIVYKVEHLIKIIVFAMLIVATGCANTVNEPSYWIDVRSVEEYQEQHIAGVINIPHEQVVDEIANVTSDKDAVIYLHCRTGRRAGVAKEALEKLGYTQVINLKTYDEMVSEMKKQGRLN